MIYCQVLCSETCSLNCRIEIMGHLLSEKVLQVRAKHLISEYYAKKSPRVREEIEAVM